MLTQARKAIKTVLASNIPVVTPVVRRALIDRMRRTFAAIPQDFPRVVTLELTNLCNAKCWMCPNPTMARKKVFMDDDLVYKIIEECRPYAQQGIVKRVGFCGVGDPTLHTSFVDFANAVDHMAEAVVLSTNAIAMSEELAEAIVRCFTEVSISINASNAQDYARTMGVLSSKFEETKANIEMLLNLKERANSNLSVYLRLTDWDNLKFDARSAAAELEKTYGSAIDGVKCVSAMSWAGRKPAPGSSSGLLMMDAPCGYLFEYLEIQANGGIALCCEDAEGEAFKGEMNANEWSVKDIWQHPQYVHYRDVHLKGGIEKLPLCDVCVRHYD